MSTIFILVSIPSTCHAVVAEICYFFALFPLALANLEVAKTPLTMEALKGHRTI